MRKTHRMSTRQRNNRSLKITRSLYSSNESFTLIISSRRDNQLLCIRIWWFWAFYNCWRRWWRVCSFRHFLEVSWEDQEKIDYWIMFDHCHHHILEHSCKLSYCTKIPSTDSYSILRYFIDRTRLISTISEIGTVSRNLKKSSAVDYKEWGRRLHDLSVGTNHRQKEMSTLPARKHEEEKTYPITSLITHTGGGVRISC